MLASVLKPVDDTRMRGKFAETLRARPGWQVHVAGRTCGSAGPAPTADTGPPVGQHRIFWGSRLGLGRLLAQGRYWRLLRALRPSMVIVHAPELLPLTLLWRALGGGRQFMYDIRENYALNVRTQQVYRGWLKRGLAAGLRWVEGAAAARAAAVLLAEASYAPELPFLARLPASRVLLLENKYQPAPGEQLPRVARPLPTPAEPLRLLFSGTISVLNGVWEAIELARHLRATRPGGATLTIVGFCQQPGLLLDLQRVAATESTWLTLVGGARLVPHRRIVAEIARSHLGLLPYRPHTSTERCQPTKLFEYLAHGLPILIPHNSLWESELSKYQAGLVVDFADAPSTAAAVAAALPDALFYPAGVPTETVQWAGEGKKLRVLLESLLPGPTFAAPFA
ncbi:glycosyltransferase [Hymenobacter sp. H14-R3]|uniref:glycosyltransferase n=1 Tax=Hymenobacter sp. H14-R3 TaxID=3046308 RepID=UPI0024B96801|nr:glycosyltransferase [Hymenobacter sp. H14-R3]MDJ0365244.1 glycosyltransferase [Hymenobacter sp. H14-R3]